MARSGSMAPQVVPRWVMTCRASRGRRSVVLQATAPSMSLAAQTVASVAGGLVLPVLRRGELETQPVVSDGLVEAQMFARAMVRFMLV